jgi:hypothetical protein
MISFYFWNGEPVALPRIIVAHIPIFTHRTPCHIKKNHLISHLNIDVNKLTYQDIQ